MFWLVPVFPELRCLKQGGYQKKVQNQLQIYSAFQASREGRVKIRIFFFKVTIN